MGSASESSSTPGVRKPKRRWFRWAIVVFVGLLIFSECFARFYLGLGDPPLMMDDPQIEYLFKPDRTYHRFGNTIHFNQYSMRSDEFPKHKADPNELRILVIGDSIINGGSLTDQPQLATAILQKHLSENLKRTVIVGNISADSWGPENQLAYINRFGKFDADVVIFVWGSEDTCDVPTFFPHSGNLLNAPTHSPPLALWDGFVRYLLPRMGVVLEKPEPIGAAATQPSASAVAAMHELIQAFKPFTKVIVYLHYISPELNQSENFGQLAVKRLAQDESVPLIDSKPAFIRAINQGTQPYRDIRHVNPAGQVLMEDLFQNGVSEALHASK